MYDNDNYPTHEAEGKTVCVMEKWDKYSNESFYQYILNSNPALHS